MTASTENSVSRPLYDLYLAVSKREAEALISAPSRLAQIRSKVVASGSNADMAIYDNLYRLISLHVPNLDPMLGLALDIPNSTKDTCPTRRIAVCGIGRSGTSLIYQQLAKLLLLDSRTVNFRYEPYLWNLRAPVVKGKPFDMSQLHQFGLLVHTTVPLFLDGPNTVHDPFVDHLFNESWDDDPSVQPDVYLTKVIRGGGRLRSYLKRYPDLKIVACLRNPVDTINSSLGMFSPFGEEFHTDDRPRLRAELEARGSDVSGLDAGKLSIEWYSAWWRAFTEEILAVAAEYPENVFLFCYEAFQNDQEKMLEALMGFVGVQNVGMFMGLGEPAGVTIKTTSLTQHDLNVLGSSISYYNNTVLVPSIGTTAAAKRTDSLVSRYLGTPFTFPIAGSDLGRRSPIQLRDMLLNGGISPFMVLAQQPAHPVALPSLIEQYHGDDSSTLYKPAQDAAALKRGKTFGAIITCHNNATTITGAVLSCLNQTLPFDEIIVIDDNSTDHSAVILAELEERYSNVKVLTFPSNLGPSVARDFGVRELSTDFFTQLDGDDLYWPTKNAQEAEIVAGDETVVAFSDILLVMPEERGIQSTVAYADRSGAEVWQALMARTPQIPRDMTVSRKLYFEAGGYNLSMHFYEDWDFKLRLAEKSRVWARANGKAGTVYNQLMPGLSVADDSSHARALSQISLRFLAQMQKAPDGLLTSFDAATSRLKTHDITQRSRKVLQAFLAQPGSDLGALARFVAQRSMHGNENMDYTAALEAFADEYLRKGTRK